MYNLIISKSATTNIKKVKRKYNSAIIEALQDIKENPFIGKPLRRELTGRFSFKVGKYRIIYKIRKRDKIVEVITFDHRSKVYG